MKFNIMVLYRILQLRRRHRYAGGRKLQLMLANPDYGLPLNIGRDRLFSLLRDHNLLSELKRKYRCFTNSKHNLPVYPNLLNSIKVSKVNQVWVCDITYIKLQKGKFCYLFLVSDYFSRKILGSVLRESLSAAGALDALQAAYKSAKQPAGVIHHSDHGIQYCCREYTELLDKMKFRKSMTSELHCYDNSVAERINGILKQEFGLGATLPNLEAAQKLLKDGIKLYNCERLHVSLVYKTPDYVYNLYNPSSNLEEENNCIKTVNL